MINRLSILFVLLTSLLALSACGGEIEYLMTKQTVYDVDGSVRYYILYEYDKKNLLRSRIATRTGILDTISHISMTRTTSLSFQKSILETLWKAVQYTNMMIRVGK